MIKTNHEVPEELCYCRRCRAGFGNYPLCLHSASGSPCYRPAGHKAGPHIYPDEHLIAAVSWDDEDGTFDNGRPLNSVYPQSPWQSTERMLDALIPDLDDPDEAPF